MNTLLKHLLSWCLLVVVLTGISAKEKDPDTDTAYTSERLVISRISPHCYVHTSYKQTNDFGKVPCNGMIVIDQHEAIIFDTPTDDQGAEELIRWLNDTMKIQVLAVIPTHFHDDCLGGLNIFHKNNIPSFAHQATIDLAGKNNLPVPQNSFKDSMTFPVGDKKVTAVYFGEGHTTDNIIGYFAHEKILFGGCLIKALKAGKGYLGDANTAAWSGTVEKIKVAYPDVRMVVPGHGAWGNKKLLDYTARLFRKP